MNLIKTTAALAAALTVMSCSQKAANTAEDGYIGPANLTIQDGKMTPEVLLSLGRLSDAQLSPDGKTILYGVSYTSIKDNRSCRNLFICNVDGSDVRQLTKDGKSINAARWANDGKAIFFLQGAQLWKAAYSDGSLGSRTQLSEVEEGVSDYLLSPDQNKVIYVSTVPSNVKSPADSDPALDKAKAYVTEDLMYRHWDHWVTELPHSYVAEFGSEKITKDNKDNVIRVFFDSDGGTDVETQKILKGEAADRPTNPTKDGYTFIGWYVVNDNVVSGTLYPFGADAKLEANLYLKAKWTKYLAPRTEKAKEEEEDTSYDYSKYTSEAEIKAAVSDAEAAAKLKFFDAAYAQTAKDKAQETLELTDEDINKYFDKSMKQLKDKLADSYMDYDYYLNGEFKTLILAKYQRMVGYSVEVNASEVIA